MKKIAAIATIVMLAGIANAGTMSYSWEDGGTILGSYGNLVDPTNVTGPQVGLDGQGGSFTCPGAVSGDYYLHVAEEPHSSTPQAFVAWIRGLQVNDVVDASFFGFDASPGASPSVRIWAHYTDAVDPDSYEGSAGGNDTYSSGIGWEEISETWTYNPSDPDAAGLMIEVRLYSSPSTGDARSDYFIDDVTVTAPDHATITFAPEPASLILVALGGLLIRRR